MPFYNQSPYHLISDLLSLPFGSDVYVVSDSKYKELKTQQARDEITLLEKRAEHYEKAAASLRATITSIEKEYQLNEASED